jgi:signal transduction histidine kinase
MSEIQKFVDANVPQRLLRVLIIEDSQVDAFLLERALQRGGFHPICQRVETPESTSDALKRHRWDLILADHSMPRFSAPEALAMVKARDLDIPFIIVSGHIEEETAVSAMRYGAHDYIMKDRLARLVPAVERELREAEVRRAQKKSEAELELRVQKRTADLKAANEKLQNLFEERRRLENELLEIAENERRNIGFDLHDDLGQRLTGVLLMTKGLESRLDHEKHPSVNEAAKIRELIEDAIHHTHNLAHQFSALNVNGDDLPCVLKSLADNVRKMFDIPCSLSIRGDIPALPENSMMQFYKIAQEAVSNAVKHGKATHIIISVSRVSDKLALTIKNDGTPFSLPEGKKNRMGLRIMNYRASTIGATFDIRPNNRNGTIVTCALPIKNGARTHRENIVKPIPTLPRNTFDSSDELRIEHAVG